MISLLNDTLPATNGMQLREELLISKALEREVQVTVLLPPGFVETAVNHPVLYLNDGQDLPRLHLQATLERLFAQNIVLPFVLVAPHANADRLHEYGVAAQADYNGRGGRAGAYAAFVADELLPFAQHTYKVSADPARAVFAGFSLGGLSAFDLVWARPDLFARAGVFSGSFWWRSRAIGDGYTPADRIMLAQVRAGQPHPSHQFWLQTGTLDEHNDRNKNGVIDSLEDTLDLVEALLAKGLSPENLRYVQVEGGHHHPDTWGRVMPDFLRWAFGTATGRSAQVAPLPVVRLQLDPELAPALVAVVEPVPAAAVAPLVLPIAPPPATSTLPPPAHHAETADPVGGATSSQLATSSTLRTSFPTDLTMPVTIARPSADEYLPFYAGYVKLVPENVDPLHALREQTQKIHAAFATLSDEQAGSTYALGKWTPKQILLHLTDTERVFAYRALRFARHDAQPLATFDQDEYAMTGAANTRSMSSLLAEYAAVRAATLALFDTFTTEQLQQQGTANNATVSVRALVYIVAGHERHHLTVFQERYQPLW